MLSRELADPIEPINKDLGYKIKKKKLKFYEKFYSQIGVKSYGFIRYVGRHGEAKTDVENRKACGKFKNGYSCGCGKTREIHLYSCNNINCPICFRKAYKRTAKRDTERFVNIARYLRQLGFKNVFFRHEVISPPDDEAYSKLLKSGKKFDKTLVRPKLIYFKDYKKWKAKVIRVLRKYFHSGLLVFHPYRVKRGSQGLVMHYSPHIHFIGIGWIPRNFFKKHSCILTRIRNVYTEKAMNSLLNYLYSHAGFFENRHINSWINHFSYNKLCRINEYKSVSPIICENCESEVYKIELEPDVITDKYIYYPETMYSFLNLDVYLKDVQIFYDFRYKKRKKFKYG